MQRLQAEFGSSERHVCELMMVPRSSYRYQRRRNDNGLRERLTALAHECPRFGYRRLHVLLRRGGERIKRLTRCYRQRTVLTEPNQEWAIDFASDATASGRRLRVFSVIDAITRECLALETDTSLPSRRVTRVLAQVIEQSAATRRRYVPTMGLR